MNRRQELAGFALRLATAANFLSAVGSRFGWWGGGWAKFLVYAEQVNSYAPPSLQLALVVTATGAETLLAGLLFVGYRTRLAALGAAGLTLLFALAMSHSFGVKEAMDYSVFVDSASALLLATMPRYLWSVDAWLERRDQLGV